jgi:beta-phosphoglucomutase
MVNQDIIRRFWPVAISDEQMTAIADGKEAMVRELYREHFPAMPGATRLVQSLHDYGFKLAVGSSGPKENVHLSCELLGIVPLLGGIVSGCDVKRGKPHPEIFLTSANHLNVLPQHCVVVEDATVGIQAAHAAGMKCIALLSTGHNASELQEADMIVHSLDEITPFVIERLLEGIVSEL